MSSTIRKIKRKQDEAASQKAESAELTEEQKRLPAGKLTTAPIRGTYNSLPLLGWVSRRKSEGTPLVMLGLALLNDEGKLEGNLQVELPVYKGETDAATVAALKRYGWRGGVWFDGSKEWPTGDDVNEDLLSTMLYGTHSLKSTLTFPPTEDGQSAAQPVEVGRAKGSFLMPPLPEPEEEDPELLARLHELCDNYTQFYLDLVLPSTDEPSLN